MPSDDTPINPFPEPSPEELRRIYDEAKAKFTADDLAIFFTEQNWIPMEDVLRELKELYRELTKSGDGS